MQKIGIVCEYNPFHNGHLYHIKRIKEMFNDSLIIAVVSGNFTQRGNISILDKYEKTNIALNHEIDIVINLPFIFATQSADLFADAAIAILNAMQVDYLIFGSESNDVKKLESLAETQINNPEYNKKVKTLLKNGINYPTAMSKALEDLNQQTVMTPNDILGLSYIKAIINQKATIKPLTIKRTNDFHSEKIDDSIASATAIRKAISKRETIKKIVPSDVYKILENNSFDNYDYFNYLKYKIISEGKNINKYLTVDEGIENRIIKVIDKCTNIDELIQNIKTKRYTYNKISRMLTHILCSITKEDASKNQKIKYIQILGFNKKGQMYLNKIKKQTEFPIITNPKYYNELLKIENKVDNIYYLITQNKIKKEVINKN